MRSRMKVHVTLAGARENGIDEDVVEVNGKKLSECAFLFYFLFTFAFIRLSLS